MTDKYNGYLIYTPKGRAREFSSLALNVYRGCDHACVYCWAPDVTHRSRQDFSTSTTRSNFIANLEQETRSWEGPKEQVLLCFTCDPY